MSKLKLTKKILGSILLILIGIIIGMLISNHTQSVKTNTTTTEPTAAIQQEQNNIKPVKVVKVLTESTDEIKPDKGDIYKEYDNGSWSIENNSTNTFIFQAQELGDWDITLHDKQQFNNLVATYLNIKETGEM